MTHPSPTSKEEMDAIRKRQMTPFPQRRRQSERDVETLLTHIAALEAELACERDDKSRLTDAVIGGAIPENDAKVLAALASLPVEKLCERLRGVYALWPGAEPRRFYTGAIMHEAARRIEQAQLSTRLPTRDILIKTLQGAQCQWMHDETSQLTRDDYEADAILALLSSGAATAEQPRTARVTGMALLREESYNDWLTRTGIDNDYPFAGAAVEVTEEELAVAIDPVAFDREPASTRFRRYLNQDDARMSAQRVMSLLREKGVAKS